MPYESRLRDAQLDRLFAGLLQLRTVEECYRFFEDLCTVGELRALAQRFQVADLLRAGCTYDAIQARTGMSSATISRIKRFLDYGADGYRLVLERLDRVGDGDTQPAAGAAGGAGAASGSPD